jgi:hypothetical protein
MSLNTHRGSDQYADEQWPKIEGHLPDCTWAV